MFTINLEISEQEVHGRLVRVLLISKNQLSRKLLCILKHKKIHGKHLLGCTSAILVELLNSIQVGRQLVASRFGGLV